MEGRERLRRGWRESERKEAKNGGTSRRCKSVCGPSACPASLSFPVVENPAPHATPVLALHLPALVLALPFLHQLIFLCLLLASPCPPLYCMDDGHIQSFSHSPSTLTIVQSGRPPPSNLSALSFINAANGGCSPALT